MIENFEEYLPYLVESQDVVSNTSVFANAVQDFYFGGNVTESNFMHNITEVRSRDFESRSSGVPSVRDHI